MLRHLYICLIMITLVCAMSSKIYAKEDRDHKFTVIIDAGHGGKDTGATDNGIQEKDINLRVAKQLESLIKEKMRNAKVIMTRNNDTYLTLQERADKANKAQGDIFISIHTNSVDKKNPNRKSVAGSSVYTLGLHKDENNLAVAMRENSVIELEKNYDQKYSGFDPQRDESYIIFEMAQKKNLSQSIQLADLIEKELVNSGREDRGVHQAGFWVLWATSMPSVLVELDFICNPESAKYMQSEKGCKELAEAIYRALEVYEDSWRKNTAGNSFISNTLIENNSLGSKDANINSESDNSFYLSTPVATARKRTPKTPTLTTLSNDNLSQQSNGRKRRSQKSKELSLRISYEKEDIEFPNNKNYDLKGNEDLKIGEDLALNNLDQINSSNLKGKNKKEEKRKQQNKNKGVKNEEKKINSKKKRSEDSHNAKLNKIVTVYKIQVLASSDLLNQNNALFCGLSPISTYKENNLYKYYYGESTERAELEEVLSDVRKKIPDAFIVSSQKTIQTKK